MPQIIRDITEIARCGSAYRGAYLAPMGLKVCHASYLTEICAEPGISQERLAQRICINKSNVARQAAVLEEEGFITRRACEQDKRVMCLYPTEKTVALLPALTEIFRMWEERLTAGLTEEEKELLLALLEKMRTRASAWMEAN